MFGTAVPMASTVAGPSERSMIRIALFPWMLWVVSVDVILGDEWWNCVNWS